MPFLLHFCPLLPGRPVLPFCRGSPSPGLQTDPFENVSKAMSSLPRKMQESGPGGDLGTQSPRWPHGQEGVSEPCGHEGHQDTNCHPLMCKITALPSLGREEAGDTGRLKVKVLVFYNLRGPVWSNRLWPSAWLASQTLPTA